MIQSLVRTLDLLDALKESGKAVPLVELSQMVDLPPSTIHRILKTLCARHYVVRDGKTHLYRLGPALISLGMAAAHNIRLQNVAPPILHKLSDMTGEDAFLVIVSGFKGLVLDKVEGPNNLKVIEKFGYEVDLHCGAIRKTLLAYQPEPFIREYMEHGLSRHARYTIVNPEQLLEDLAKIRREGIAVSRGEYIQDAFGIGAPIFGFHGEVIASMGIIAPASRIDENRIDSLKRDVKQCAEELSRYWGNIKGKRNPDESHLPYYSDL